MDREILAKVYELAMSRHSNYVNEEKDNYFTFQGDGVNINFNKTRETELFKYLESLTYEQNLMILTIMYIGRGDCREQFEENKDPNDIYKNMLNYLRGTSPNNELTITQIYQKEPLDEYLRKGFKLLKIEI